ncbi:MAG: hypothetical protein NTW85_08830 [Methylococcales bacterium]|nr:hypothetical protein [Methylococcales bacterium]
MNKKSISEDIKKQVNEIVQKFNEQIINKPNRHYLTRYKGSNLFLDFNDYGKVGSICRLKYNGEMDNWKFAIYKYSKNQYDPDEWMFPGGEYIDGTIEGAMKAGIKAYVSDLNIT